MTRAEAITLILHSVLEHAMEDEHMVKWTDNQPGDWYYKAVQEATNSHEYVCLPEQAPDQDFCYEDWQKILEKPDWAALEKTLSTANSK